MKSKILIAHNPTPQDVALHRAKLSMMNITPGIEPVMNDKYYRRTEKIQDDEVGNKENN